MPYTIEPPPASDTPKSRYTIEPPPAPPVTAPSVGARPGDIATAPLSIGERMGDITGRVLRAGKGALEETGLMPPALPGMQQTAEEYRQKHPRVEGEGTLQRVGRAAGEALHEVGPMSSLLLGPGAIRDPLITPTSTPAKPPSSGISAERASLAKEARDTFKIPISAVQVGMSNFGKIMESASRSLPFSGARGFEAAQRRAWNRALSQTFGEDSPVITPTEMSAAKKRIGGVLNRVENTNDVVVDINTIQRLGDIEHAAQQSLTDAEFGVVQRQIDNIIGKVDPTGKIPGTTYGALLRRDGPLDKAMGNSNSNIARPASQIADVMRDALQQSLSGSDLADYRLARFQYKNMKTLQPLVNKSPTGDISPALLNGRVSVQFPNRAFDTSGANPLDRLAKIGQAFLKEPPTSATAERGSTLAELGKMGGALAAGDVFGGVNAAAGIGGTLAANRALSAYLRSKGLSDRTIARALAANAPKVSNMGSSAQALRVLPSTIFGLADHSDTMRRAAQPVSPPTQPDRRSENTRSSAVQAAVDVRHSELMRAMAGDPALMDHYNKGRSVAGQWFDGFMTFEEALKMAPADRLPYAAFRKGLEERRDELLRGLSPRSDAASRAMSAAA